ncbi:hypothetical protein TSUD_219720 [Trifolium subterraneum]|uniref:RNase H type-1 domain-containing protein n=1 Tax=Trifolium subterraneum TaxID=3900 RepID=A0A2Z6PA88_TRISU|nr:hypothetical protein TSUD_219720 [Trifolium subterraneum]
MDNGRDERVVAGGGKNDYSVAIMDIEETILHALSDCPVAKALWMQVLPVACRGWCNFWATTCHCLWTWKNKEFHEEAFVRPTRPILHIQKFITEYAQAMKTTVSMDVRGKTVDLIGWLPPKENYVKLNTDGAISNTCMAGCGGVVRGSEGEWMGGYAKCVGSSSVIVAEACEVLEGL